MADALTPEVVERDDPDLPIEGAAFEPDLTVLGFVEETKKAEADQRQRTDEIEVRERYVFGDQSRVRDLGVEANYGEADVEQTYVQENLLYPLVLTYAARIDQTRADPRAFPAQASATDVAQAAVANAVLDYERQRRDEASHVAKAAVYAQIGGKVLFLTTWDESVSRRVRRQKWDEATRLPAFDPATRQPVTEDVEESGGLLEELLTVADYVTSGEERYEDARWVRVRRLLDRFDARAVLEAAGFPDRDPRETEVRTALDGVRRGVLAYEVFHRPSSRVPQGFRALVVDGVAVSVEPYPYAHGELPGAEWKIGDVPGSPHGKTHVSDAVHQQRLVNASLRAVVDRMTIARDSALVGTSAAITQWTDQQRKRVRLDSQAAIDSIKHISGPEIPPSLFRVLDDARASLHSVFGVSEATVTGGDPTETKSGKQLRDATALDAQKQAPARRSLHAARKRCAVQTLRLWQQFVDEPTLVRVVGDDGGVFAGWFSGADVGGADVVVEIGSGVLAGHFSGQKYAEESGQAGYIGPREAAERRETGLGGTVDEASDRARVQQQVQQVAGGAPATPLPDVDPKKAADVVHLMLGSVPREAVGKVVELLRMYEDAARQPAQGPGKPGQPPQGGAPQGGVVKTTKTQTQQQQNLETGGIQ